MRRYNGHNIAAVFAVFFALVIGAALPSLISPLRAQLSAQSTWIPAASVGGSANAITLTVPNVASMADLVGVPVRFIPSNNNTATTTINISPVGGSAFGAITVKRSSPAGLVTLAGGDFISGSQSEVVYDGTEERLQVPVSSAALPALA